MTPTAAFADLGDRVIERAMRQTGLDDLGDSSFRAGFDRLVAAIASDPRIESVHGHVVSELTEIVAGRLRSEKGWRLRPDVLDQDVPAPVVIVGLPRTGTTMLHKLMSMDSRFQTLQSWLIWSPQVRPPRDQWATDPDYQWSVRRAVGKGDRQKATHYVEADEPDECIRLMCQQFVSNYFGSTWPVPEYDDWFMAHDQRDTFERYADNLRLIGADDTDQPWLLKNPSHVLALDSLLATFPRAQIIQTHRDPLACVPSLCSVLAIYREAAGLEYDPLELGGRELRVWSEAVRRVARVRAEHPDSIVDVDYNDLLRQPVYTARAAFQALGLDVTPATEQAMTAWVQSNPQGKHGEHRYRGDTYGLDEATLREAFAEYRNFRQFDGSR